MRRLTTGATISRMSSGPCRTGLLLPYMPIEANNEALKQFIVCPDGIGTGTCAASELERVQVDIVNWPGSKTSGIDLHLGGNTDAGVGKSRSAWMLHTRWSTGRRLWRSATWCCKREQDAAGYLNFGNPIATSLPKLKGQVSAGYHWGTYRLVSFLNYISSYEDRGRWIRKGKIISLIRSKKYSVPLTRSSLGM